MSHKLCLAPALVLALASGPAHALGIGGIRQQSALDQPFVGEIDLVDVKPDELDAVKVQIAPQTEFSRAGTERYHYLTKLRFTPQISPRGNPVIRVSSREPMREPYMDFLVEVVWPKGRLVKQYTVLLDPPVTTARAAPRIAEPVVDQPPPGRPAPRAAEAPPARAAATATQAPPARPAKAPPRSQPVAAPGGESGKRIGPTRSGAGLWRLALGNTPPGATVSQTAMALYRTNQDAFANGDINRLIIGKMLTLPHPGELLALSPEAAKLEFESAIKGGKVRRSPIAGPDAPAGAPGKGDARLRIAGAAGDGAKSKAAAADSGGGGAQDMEKELLLVRETSESARQETVELRGRIHDLESQLSEIQQLLRLRNEELARVQSGAGLAPGVKAAAADAPPAVPPVASATGASVAASPGGARGQSADAGTPSAVTAVGSASAARASVAAPTAVGTAPSAAGATAAARPGIIPAGTFPWSQSRPSSPAPAGTGAPGRPPVATSTKAGGLAPTPGVSAAGGGSTWYALLWPLAAVAAVTALGIGALAWMRTRRRLGSGSDGEFDAVESLPPESAAAGAKDAGAGGDVARAGPSLDLATFGLEEPEPAPAPETDMTTDIDEADILSEADIYIAYGRYREAEDLLRAEMRHTPGRLDLMFKLAEAYYAEKDTVALRGLMQEVQAAGGDRSSPAQWRRLSEMAAAIPVNADGLPASAPPAQGVASGPAWDHELMNDATETVGTESAEVYTVDVSDFHESLATLALTEAPPRVPGLGAPAPARPLVGAPSGRGTAGSEPGSAAALAYPPPSLSAEPLLSLDLSLDTSFDGQPLAEAFDPVGGSVAAPGDSALELNLDDSLHNPVGHSAVPDALDQYFDLDSVGTIPQRGDLTLTKGGGAAAVSSPANHPPPATDLPTTRGSPDSDALSSQWQLDSSVWDEAATALDLARAYIEMGDHESAKGILEEVVGEGSEAQCAEARELLRRVG
ncbi:FimV/HubP family polar landmark protein [uncultured Thiodictyon sp.]|uniref:FimV/HubP family polar landmark protein n=1 Tax=uncultured Thiodictyon sp. TaxID=1846217 RepID=UPI0025EC2744|nr:FimV/HubP family polar landmark protein [uncultured Thiodictyon sp.]